MVLYFVSKLKLVSNKPTKKGVEKNKVTLLCCSSDYEEAWKMVKEQAHAYKTKKNDKLCDQTEHATESIVKEIYKIKNPKESEDKVHTIEVIKQWRRQKGWLDFQDSYKEMKIAEFSMVKFDNVEKEIKKEIKPDLGAIARVVGTGHPELMKDLRNSDLFNKRIKQVDRYSRYPNPVDDPSESE